MDKLQKYLRDKSAGAFAAKIRVHESTLSQIRSGKRRPSVDVIYRIQKATRGKITLKDWVKDA